MADRVFPPLKGTSGLSHSHSHASDALASSRSRAHRQRSGVVSLHCPTLHSPDASGDASSSSSSSTTTTTTSSSSMLSLHSLETDRETYPREAESGFEKFLLATDPNNVGTGCRLRYSDGSSTVDVTFVDDNGDDDEEGSDGDDGGEIVSERRPRSRGQNRPSPRSPASRLSRPRSSSSQVDTQMEEDIGNLLSEMKGMSRGVDELLSKMSTSAAGRHRKVSHRRRMSQSLPDLSVLKKAQNSASKRSAGSGLGVHNSRDSMRSPARSFSRRGSYSCARSGARSPAGSSGSKGGGERGRSSSGGLKRASAASFKHRRTAGSMSRSTRKQPSDDLTNSLFGCSTLAGAVSVHGKKAKENQDSYLVHEGYPSPNAVVFAIFDGHGPQGKKVSQFCADNFIATLQKFGFHEKRKAGNAEASHTSMGTGTNRKKTARCQTVSSAFHSLHDQLHACAFDTVQSGCTAVACVAIPAEQTLVVMHCGDSSALLGSVRPSSALQHSSENVQGEFHKKGDGFVTQPNHALDLAQSMVQVNAAHVVGDVVCSDAVASGDCGGGLTRSRPRRSSSSRTAQEQHAGAADKGHTRTASHGPSPSPPLVQTKPTWRLKFLTREHKPSNPKERLRIEAAGGIVHCMDGDCERVWGGDPTDSSSKANSGIAMSRSLGDEDLHNFGVTTEPDVREVPISSSDDFIILGSDGVWDMINEFDVIALIDKAQAETATSERKDEAQEATAVVNVRAASDALPSWDAAAVAYDLCRMARKRWREKANRIDDITAIAVNLRRVMARTMSANISAGTSPPARRRAPSHDKVKSTSHRARGVSSMR